MSDKNSLLTLFVAVVALFIVSSVNAKIPDYIHVCTRNDPGISTCINSSIYELKPQLLKGIPELEVPKLEPLKLDHMILNLGPGIKAEGKDVLLYGAKDFEIQDLVLDLKKDTLDINVFIPTLTAKGTYDLDAKIGAIPLKGTGPLLLAGESVTGRIGLHGKKVAKAGKTYYYFSSMDLKMAVKDYELKLENIAGGDPVLGNVTNNVLKEEKANLLLTLLPAIEKSLGQYLLNSANNICKHFTWDELFPES